MVEYVERKRVTRIAGPCVRRADNQNAAQLDSPQKALRIWPKSEGLHWSGGDFDPLVFSTY
jgi:hypothetical protein